MRNVTKKEMVEQIAGKLKLLACMHRRSSY